jgi:hypothetical protein
MTGARSSRIAASLLLASFLLSPQVVAAGADPAQDNCKGSAATASDPWAGKDTTNYDDECVAVPEFEPPEIRLGLHVQGGVSVGDDFGGFAGLELLLGARVQQKLSVILRGNADLGAWNQPSATALTSASLGLGLEYLTQDLDSPGTGIALGLTVGAWLRDGCETPSCLRTLLPTATLNLGLLFGGDPVPTNPIAAFSVGLTGSAGYDPIAESMAGRAALYFGFELSDR